MLFGACESFYKPDLDAKVIEETVSQVLVSACDRDSLSGWGGIAYVM